MPFDPHHLWLGIRPSSHGISHYRLLGLDVFESDPRVIANAADRQMAHVRSFQNGPHAADSQRLLAEIAAARVCLMDREEKERYDEQLSLELLSSGEGPAEDGAAFGQYLLLDQLAVASASNIYKARHRTMGRDVALQTLAPAAAADPREVARFQRKSALLASLDHPGFIRAHDAGVRDSVHCLVMELVTGDNLHTHMQNDPEPQQAVQWIKQAAAGLGHAHARGVVHRRVALSNMIASPRGVKITGLGLALRIDEAPPESTETTVGNIDYVAPEQLEDCRAVDARADIYGLGCALCALLRRRAAFSGSVGDKAEQHRRAAPPRLTGVAGVDEPLQSIVHQMMAKAPQDRYCTMYEVIEALQGWLLARTVPPPVSLSLRNHQPAERR